MKGLELFQDVFTKWETNVLEVGSESKESEGNSWTSALSGLKEEQGLSRWGVERALFDLCSFKMPIVWAGNYRGLEAWVQSREWLVAWNDRKPWDRKKRHWGREWSLRSQSCSCRCTPVRRDKDRPDREESVLLVQCPKSQLLNISDLEEILWEFSWKVFFSLGIRGFSICHSC